MLAAFCLLVKSLCSVGVFCSTAPQADALNAGFVVRRTRDRTRDCRVLEWKHFHPLTQGNGREIDPFPNNTYQRQTSTTLSDFPTFCQPSKHRPCIHPDKTKTTGASQEAQRPEEGLHQFYGQFLNEQVGVNSHFQTRFFPRGLASQNQQRPA